MIARRAFLTGLGSLFVAPAIVRADNLMKVKSFEPTFFERWIYDYSIGTDQMLLRVDWALFPLPVSKRMNLVDPRVGRQMFIDRGIDVDEWIQPNRLVAGQQRCINMPIAWSDVPAQLDHIRD